MISVLRFGPARTIHSKLHWRPPLRSIKNREELLRSSVERELNDLCDGAQQPDGTQAIARDVRVGTLASLTASEVVGGGDGVAGVLVRLSGSFDQVGLLAMEPEDAFELVRCEAGNRDPLAAYTALGGLLVGRLATAVDALGVAQEGEPTLQEDSVIGTLLRTHAPSDTVVVSVSLSVSWAGSEASRAASVYLLADPKPFAAALAAA